jgi:hypothetical protein
LRARVVAEEQAALDDGAALESIGCPALRVGANLGELDRAGEECGALSGNRRCSPNKPTTAMVP